jgi:hypothetical protein
MKKECKHKNTSTSQMKISAVNTAKEMHFPQASHYARRTLMVFSLYSWRSTQWVGKAKFMMEWAPPHNFTAGRLLEVERARKKKQALGLRRRRHRTLCGFLLHGLTLLKKVCGKIRDARRHQAYCGAHRRRFSQCGASETAEWFSQACIRKSKSEWMDAARAFTIARLLHKAQSLA